MKKVIFIISLFFISSLTVSNLYAQQKNYYFVTFTDKGITQNENLYEHPEYLKATLDNLSERSKQRRAKHLGAEKIVNYDDVPLNEAYLCELKCIGVSIRYALKWFNAALIATDSITSESIRALPFVASLEKYGTVTEPNNGAKQAGTYRESIFYDSAGTYGNALTQLELSDVPQVHALGFDGNGVLIGMLDSGFDWKYHESLSNQKVIDEFDFVFKDTLVSNEQNDTEGQDGHGTYCFSITGGYKIGKMVGVAYDAAFMLAKTEDGRSETRVEEVNYAAALEWMDSAGVDITSSSLGYTVFDDFRYTYEDLDGKTALVSRAVDKAFEKGIVTLTAAGNEGNKSWQYLSTPADAFNVIAVGALAPDNGIAFFTSKGPTSDRRLKPEISTMGISVFGVATNTLKGYVFKNGTSSATPIAAGIAALLLQAHPHLKNHQVRDIFLKSGDAYFTPDTVRGHGCLSALRAVTFPNIDITENKYIMHKLFTDIAENDSPCSLVLMQKGSVVDSLQMVSANDLVYTCDLSTLPNNAEYEFYFSYIDTTGAYRIEKPEIGYYKVSIGDESIGYSELLQDFGSIELPLTTTDIKEGKIIPHIADKIDNKISFVIKAENNSGAYSVSRTNLPKKLFQKEDYAGLISINGEYVYITKIGRIVKFSVQ